jgi:hypothetical protein
MDRGRRRILRRPSSHFGLDGSEVISLETVFKILDEKISSHRRSPMNNLKVHLSHLASEALHGSCPRWWCNSSEEVARQSWLLG